jgi:tRNA threonylcarbamoyladenosine biosynthesis protein TsaE
LGEKIGCDLAFNKLKLRILCLYGELGSGKTTFIQGLACGLGIKKRIVSPTFVFMKRYAIRGTQDIFYHIDLYRIEKFEDTRSLGLEEIFADPNGIIAIEWAEKITKILPKKRMDIQFNYLNYNKRKVTIKERLQ